MKKLILSIAFLATSACATIDDTADEKVTKQAKQAMDGLQSTVGQPRIVNWTEARLMNRIYELRDQPNLITFTYRSDMNGGLHCLGKSIGYGLPYSAQRTNPQRPMSGWGESGQEFRDSNTIPQPEPNGLFMPESAAATWVLLVDGKGNPTPVYVEDDITVSPFPLQNVVEQCKA